MLRVAGSSEFFLYYLLNSSNQTRIPHSFQRQPLAPPPILKPLWMLLAPVVFFFWLSLLWFVYESVLHSCEHRPDERAAASSSYIPPDISIYGTVLRMCLHCTKSTNAKAILLSNGNETWNLDAKVTNFFVICHKVRPDLSIRCSA